MSIFVRAGIATEKLLALDDAGLRARNREASKDGEPRALQWPAQVHLLVQQGPSASREVLQRSSAMCNDAPLYTCVNYVLFYRLRYWYFNDHSKSPTYAGGSLRCTHSQKAGADGSCYGKWLATREYPAHQGSSFSEYDDFVVEMPGAPETAAPTATASPDEPGPDTVSRMQASCPPLLPNGLSMRGVRSQLPTPSAKRTVNERGSIPLLPTAAGPPPPGDELRQGACGELSLLPTRDCRWRAAQGRQNLFRTGESAFLANSDLCSSSGGARALVEHGRKRSRQYHMQQYRTLSGLPRKHAESSPLEEADPCHCAERVASRACRLARPENRARNAQGIAGLRHQRYTLTPKQQRRWKQHHGHDRH